MTGIENMLEILTYVTFTLIIIISLFEILDYLDYKFKIPYYSKMKRNRDFERFSKTIDRYFKRERKFLESIEGERLKILAEQLGVSEKRIGELRDEIIKWRFSTGKTVEEWKRVLEKRIIKDPILIDQRGRLKTIYNLKYFIDLRNICSENTFVDKLVKMLICLIKENLSERELRGVTKVIIPCRGNFPLGMGVAKKLNKPYIKMRTNYFMLEDQKWEGKLTSKDTVIIIHDVTIEAKQLDEDLRNLQRLRDNGNGLKILGIFTVIERKDYNPMKALEEFNVNLYSMLRIDDNDIEKMMEE